MDYQIETGPSERIRVEPSAVEGLVMIAPEYANDEGAWTCPVAYSITPTAAWSLAAVLKGVASEVDPQAADSTGEKAR